MSFTRDYLQEIRIITDSISVDNINLAAKLMAERRRVGGRLFILGVGGSAANASHAVNDFRKICNIEAYAPTDNVSELTARTNDEGWDTVFEQWLITSRLLPVDMILVLSVGGGTPSTSKCLINALRFAEDRDALIIGIVGRDGGFTAKAANVTILIPTVNEDHITPIVESWQAIIWHLLVNHPELKCR